MTAAVNPGVNRNGLLLNMDFGSKTKYAPNHLAEGNLVTSPNYDTTNWWNVFPANTRIITGIDAPDGSNTAVRMECRPTGSSLLRVNFPAFTANGTDEYTSSFYVRKIYGTQSIGGQLWTDVHDQWPSLDYQPKLITNKWTLVSAANIPSAGSKSFIDLLSDNTTDSVLDFWGVSLRQTTLDHPIVFQEQLGKYQFKAYRPKFLSVEENFIKFDRTTTGGKWGGIATVPLTGELESKNFLYKNHTIEIWFRIDDMFPTAVDATEGVSILMAYAGYHAGLFYSSTDIFYGMWDATSAMPNCAVWNLNTHFQSNRWHQLVVTRSGNTFVPYIDGVASGVGTTTAPNPVGIATGNGLFLGGAYRMAQGVGNYINYSKNSVSILRMYNRALTAAEVQGNFNANRSRFGI